MGKRRKNKKTVIETDTVIDLDAQREARRRQLREAAAESRRKRGVQDPQSGYDLYDDRSDIQEDVPEGEGADGKKLRKKRKRPAPVRIVIAVVALIAVICLICSAWNIVSLKIEEKECKEKIEQLKDEKKELKEDVGSIGTEEYIEEQARQWLKMAKSGEIIYVFEDSGKDGKDGQDGADGTQKE